MTHDLNPKDLIQAEIDGVATPEQREALRGWADRDPSVREELRDMQGLSELLSRVEKVAPPETLAADVMRAIRLERRSKAQDRGGWLRSFWPSGRAALPFAYAAAAGAAVCFLAIRGLSGVPATDAAGTMMAPAGDAIGRSELRAGSLRGEATLRRAGGSFLIEISLDAPGSGTVGLRFDPSETVVLGIVGGSHGLSSVAGAQGELSFSQRSGDKVRVLVSSRSPRPSRVSLELTGASGERARGALDVPGQGI